METPPDYLIQIGVSVLAVTVGHRTNSGQSCYVSGQICYLSGQK